MEGDVPSPHLDGGWSSARGKRRWEVLGALVTWKVMAREWRNVQPEGGFHRKNSGMATVEGGGYDKDGRRCNLGVVAMGRVNAVSANQLLLINALSW